MRLTQLLSLVSAALVLAGALVVDSAAAQPSEKRIALVIGNAAYAKAPLSTAANDGGLIAQTLQAAGFDVSGARDLDGDTLRGAFRDFMKKAEEAGPDTVAAVYLAGYGVQYAGENYFIPVDSRIARDTDIPTEGLRIGDYLRQLAALPLKTSVVVLDLAREQPFVPGGSIASGLAMVEPNPKMLIAFNAAPGTVAPEERGAYGVYAQALAEMIRSGGLTLPQLFDRVRLRVNETTKGAQVPWDTRTVETSFMFFDRAPDAPPLPAPDQALRSKPIRDMAAAEAYAAALDRDSLQGYEEFLAAYPDDPLAKRVRAIVAARREAITWRRTYRVDTPDAYWSYLRRYPRGPHAADARRRLAILAAALEPPPSFTVIDYDVPPPPPDEIVYVDRPVLMFSDPEFDFAPPPPPPVYFLPPPPPDFVVLPPPPPPIGLFYLPRPLFVPIPAYVQPPVYVQPPPNNIIFANIHNTTGINQVINQPPAVAANPAAPLVAPPVAAAPGAAPAVEPSRAGVASAALAGGVIGAALPAAVMHRAALIQQGKAPLPPSASIATAPQGGFAARPGVQLRGPRLVQQPAAATPSATPTPAPAASPAGTPSSAPGTVLGRPGQRAAPLARPARPGPGAPGTATPGAQALPVPGTKGLPPAPGGTAAGARVASPVPNAGRPGPGPAGAAGLRAGPPQGQKLQAPPPGAATAARPETGNPAAAAAFRRTPTVVTPARPAGPPAGAADRRPTAPQLTRPAPPTVAKPVPPPMHVAPRVAPPPRAEPRMASPPPRIEPRVAPPPAPRMAPPPHVAPPAPPRMAAPPSPPRGAPPPAPPRAAPPPRPAGPPKKCRPEEKTC
ncbi:MAG: caspase family protein [Rhodopseudomonas palustris]|uniref:Caspase family protein n=1 Tax=Rhodopseudomonas palustris TaxID=1076 RepID=A0A933RX55_RHOPL|nr:caspase family protein [Rhodopseudomonas palustris]